MFLQDVGPSYQEVVVFNRQYVTVLVRWYDEEHGNTTSKMSIRIGLKNSSLLSADQSYEKLKRWSLSGVQRDE